MGQYHLLVNLDKREFVHPHYLGDGLKAWEQFASGSGGTASAAVFLMVCPEPRGGGDFHEEIAGRWHGDRVVWVGDYAEPDDFEPVSAKDMELTADMIYGLCARDNDARRSIVDHVSERFAEDQNERDKTFLLAVSKNLWFENITHEVRRAMEREHGFIKYDVEESTTKYLDGSTRKSEYVDRREVQPV